MNWNLKEKLQVNHFEELKDDELWLFIQLFGKLFFSCFIPDEEEDTNSEKAENIKPLNAKLEDLQTCNDLVGKHGSALQRSIVELQEVEDNPALAAKLKFVNEKATLFRITANAMISVSNRA